MNNVVQSFYTWYKNTLRNTKYRWLIVAGTLLYLISPIDISPDFIPVIGWIDDGVIATLLIAEMSQIALDFLKNRKQPLSTENATVIEDDVITVEAR